jgi:hypothetical protein
MTRKKKKTNLEDRLLNEIRDTLSATTSQDEIYRTFSNPKLKAKAIKAEVALVKEYSLNRLQSEYANLLLLNKLLNADNTSLNNRLKFIQNSLKTYTHAKSMPRRLGGKLRHQKTSQYKEIAFRKYKELYEKNGKFCYNKTLLKALNLDEEISKEAIPWNIETLATWVTEFKRALIKEGVS